MYQQSLKYCSFPPRLHLDMQSFSVSLISDDQVPPFPVLLPPSQSRPHLPFTQTLLCPHHGFPCLWVCFLSSRTEMKGRNLG